MSNRTERIKFRLSDEDLKELDRKAEKAHMSRSKYIRFRINNCKIIRTPDIDYNRYTEQVKKIGDELDRQLEALKKDNIFNEAEVADTCERLTNVLKALDFEITEKLKIEIQNAEGEM